MTRGTPSLGNYVYTLGLAGERTAVAETGRTVSYEYNRLNQLTKESITVGTSTGDITYGLDDQGNRTTRTPYNLSAADITTQSGSSTSFNRANMLVGGYGSTFQYDSQLNQTVSSYVSAAVAGTDAYDYDNHLISRTGGSSSIYLEYDAEGNRVKKTTGSGTIYYLTDDQNPTGYSQVVETRTLSGSTWTVQNRWLYGIMAISQSDSGGLKWYYGYDGHNNVRFLVNPSGAKAASYNYDAYGIDLNSTGPTVDSNPLRYCGEQWDTDLGLYFLRARYYNPALGRFTGFDSFEGVSEDPASLHRYLYCASDPVNQSDPSGMFSLSEINVTGFIQSTLNGIRTSGPLRALDFVERVLDVANTFRDIVSLFQNSSVFTDYLMNLKSQAGAASLNYDLRKLNAMGLEHIEGISLRVVTDFPQIVNKIRKNHGVLIKNALRSPSKATLIISLPSLPGSFSGVSIIRPIPAIPARVGPFKVKFALANNGTGGSFFGLGLEAGSVRKQLFRVDYHGRKKGSEPDGVYFQTGPKILGESFAPWFHYHTPK